MNKANHVHEHELPGMNPVGFLAFSIPSAQVSSCLSVSIRGILSSSKWEAFFEHVDVLVHLNVDVAVDGFCLISSWNKFTAGGLLLLLALPAPPT